MITLCNAQILRAASSVQNKNSKSAIAARRYVVIS
jgi:hypothetical protein